MFNEASAPYGVLSEIDALDWQVVLDVVKGTSVKTGGLTTAQGTPDGTVAVSGGTARIAAVDKTITAGNVSVLSGAANPDGSTASAAHATLPRYDLIVLNSSSQLGVIHGSVTVPTYANNYVVKPVYPAWAATQVVLAVIYVSPADQTDGATVTTAKIVPKDVHIVTGAFHDEIHAFSTHTGSINDGAHGVRTLANAHALPDLSGFITAAQGLGLPQALTGAVSATRYVGATASVAPTTGTFAIGDFVITQNGKIFICTVAGTPGTWVQVGGASTTLATDTLWDAKGDKVFGTGADTAAKVSAPASLSYREYYTGVGATGYEQKLRSVRASADGTPITANTTLANDAAMLWAVLANEVWFFTLRLILSSANTTMDWKAGWSWPTGTTMIWGLAGVGSGTTGGWAATNTGANPIAALTESGVSGSGSIAASGTFLTEISGVVIVGANAGNVNLQLAQNTSDAGALTRKANSLLLLDLVA